MMLTMVSCYHSGAVVPPHSFFILSKGCNPGKPGFEPWANSFIVSCAHESPFKFHYWLIHGLHLSGKVKPCHRGSVIPFINLNDVRDTLREVAPLIHPDWSRYLGILSSLENLSKLKANLLQQVTATEKLQQALLQKYFLEIKKVPQQ